MVDWFTTGPCGCGVRTTPSVGVLAVFHSLGNRGVVTTAGLPSGVLVCARLSAGISIVVFVLTTMGAQITIGVRNPELWDREWANDCEENVPCSAIDWSAMAARRRGLLERSISAIVDTSLKYFFIRKSRFDVQKNVRLKGNLVFRDRGSNGAITREETVVRKIG
jgi:hypothetical protein